jgi:uncharacterized protein
MAETAEERPANPFQSESARTRTSYAMPDGEDLVLAVTREPARPLAQRVHAAFRALVLDPEYPCVGSRSAINQGSYRFALYDEMNSPDDTEAFAHDLYEFVSEQPHIDGEFTTFVACFDSPKALTAEDFEDHLWRQLRSLHELDRQHHEWDPAASSDPHDPRFSFSFGGRSFFVVGLSPGGERWARTFPWPLLAFNAHEQFQQLRAEGKFRRMQEIVRERDAQIEGEENANLADFGEHTDASQYAGRHVEGRWRCPVSFE